MPAAAAPDIDAAIATAIAEKKLPGAVVAIGHRDGLVFLKAYGDRALVPEREAMTLDTVFDLASLTKPIATALLTMQAVERGQLKLDDNVSTHLPELRARHPDITVRDLLVHASGLPAEDPLSNYDAGRDAALPRWAALRRDSAPGARFGYGDTGYLLLGALLERVTGIRLDGLARRDLFEPLGMRHTQFSPSHAWRALVAPTELADDVRRRIDPTTLDYPVIRGTVHDPRAFRMGGVAGNAGLFSTAHDLSRFARMMLNDGALDGVRVLSSQSVATMTAPVFLDGAVRTLGWDMRSKYSGLRGDQLSHRAYGHGGFTGVSMWIDPSLDLFVVFLSNRVHPSGDGYVIKLAGAVADAAARRFGRAPGEAACKQLEGATQLGIDVLRAQDFAPLVGRKVALVVNSASRARDGTPTRELFAAAKKLSLVALFAPEHGVEASREGRIADSTDTGTGLPVYSLFGKQRKPTADMLRGVDTIVFDLQDVGVRFFTYMSTLRQLLEAAAEQDVQLVVLDRPNPLDANTVEGPVLDEGRETFVNFHRLPARHGMTAGELAGLLNAERNIGAKLHVVGMRGYARELSYAQTGLKWQAPSPNLPTLEAALSYPAVGLLESANVSVGRGTTSPFSLVGAPWLHAEEAVDMLRDAQLPGVAWSAMDFIPGSDRYAGELCHGVVVRITDARAFRAVHTGLWLASTLRKLHPHELEAAKFGKLIGSEAVLASLLSGHDVGELEGVAEPELMRFEARRAPFLLYPHCKSAEAPAHAPP